MTQVPDRALAGGAGPWQVGPMPKLPTAVWLLAMGGPDGPRAARPFLRRLLSDRDLLRLPVPWVQPIFAELVSRLRAARVRQAYARFGGVSPQLGIARGQAADLQELLGDGFACRPVFRYWGESAADAGRALLPGQPVVLLSLYPHRCGATSGSSIRDARRALCHHDGAVTEIEHYPEQPGYVAAVAETVREALRQLPPGEDAVLLFSAHGLPLSRVRAGDPYPDELRATVAAVLAELDLGWPHRLCFQSRVGPVRWMGPATAEVLAELGGRNVAVVPVSFTSEHLETLIELDVELRELAREAGVRRFLRCSAVNRRPAYIGGLAALVLGAIETEA